MKSISIIGCGNIGLSVAKGLMKEEHLFEKLFLTKRNTASIQEFSSAKVDIGSDNLKAVTQSKVIILGLKPYKTIDIVREIAPVLTNDKILISLASEISITEIAEASNHQCTVVRAMPNTAAAIDESITCLCANNISPEEKVMVSEIFGAIGENSWIEENLMEAATILGACGIAYALRFIRAMIQGGIQIGFDAETANKITTQTVKGAASLLIKNGLHPEAEIDKVTTPMGCTITGLNEMEFRGFSSAVIKGIVTSYEKIES